MANEQNLIPINSERAREMQKKSTAKRVQNARERRLFKEILKERLKVDDANDIVDALIARSMANSKDLELLLAMLGEKPKEEISVDGGVVILDDLTKKTK